MKIGYGNRSGWVCVVFKSEYHATRWEWLFYGILRRARACFGGYDNAYRLFYVGGKHVIGD